MTTHPPSKSTRSPLLTATLPNTPYPETLRSALRAHWPLYLFEAIELALFMISACLFTVWLFHPDSLLPHLLPSPSARRALMGLAMGATAVLIIRSDIGKRSGAHFNPAITLTYLRLGKINPIDAHFYVLSHFAGGLFGVGLSTLLIGPRIATPSVNYAVTVPGLGGPPAAFFAELFMAALLMFTVLWVSNHPRLFPYTSYLVGTLIAFYILLFAPVSGSSINPARTLAPLSSPAPTPHSGSTAPPPARHARLRPALSLPFQPPRSHPSPRSRTQPRSASLKPSSLPPHLEALNNLARNPSLLKFALHRPSKTGATPYSDPYGLCPETLRRPVQPADRPRAPIP